MDEQYEALLRDLNACLRAVEDIVLTAERLEKSLRSAVRNMDGTPYEHRNLQPTVPARHILIVPEREGLRESIRRVRKEIAERFILIETASYEERPVVVRRVAGFVQDVLDRLSPDVLIVNLRWAPMPAHLERQRTIVIGTRFHTATEPRVRSIVCALRMQGFLVVEDTGLYGGARMMYALARLIENQTNAMSALELTVSESIAIDPSSLERVLDAIDKSRVSSDD